MSSNTVFTYVTQLMLVIALYLFSNLYRRFQAIAIKTALGLFRRERWVECQAVKNKYVRENKVLMSKKKLKRPKRA